MLIKNWSAVPWHWDLWRGGVEAQIKAFYFLSILFSHLIIKQFGIFFKRYRVLLITITISDD
jgi:hypothetical protein